MGKYKHHHSKLPAHEAKTSGSGIAHINNPATGIPGLGNGTAHITKSSAPSSVSSTYYGTQQPVGGALINGLKNLNFNKKKGGKIPVVKLRA